jgi:hypothetical protein
MDNFKQYRRKQIAELRPYILGEDLRHVSISAPDREAGSPVPGDMIARNPKNHKDQWLVAKEWPRSRNLVVNVAFVKRWRLSFRLPFGSRYMAMNSWLRDCLT